MSSFDEILDGLISNFPDDKKALFLHWADLRTKIKTTKENYTEAINGFKKWDNLNQIFIIFSVIVPIITTSLTSAINLTVWANLLSAVFPALVGLIRGKTKVWGQKRDGYNNLISGYERLLSDVVEDIYSNRFTADVEQKHKKELADLEAENRRIDGLDSGQ